MTRSRCKIDKPLPVRIRPPFGERANEETVRSRSPASRMLTGITSTFSEGATAWIAANCPVPEVVLASLSTTTRVMVGAILHEQLQPFSAETVLIQEKTCGIATRPNQTVDEAGTDRVNNSCKH